MNNIGLKLHFHHTGLLVNNIIRSIEHYAQLFGKDAVSAIFHVSSQNVKVCFIKIADNSYIELVEPVDETSVVYKLLKNKTSYYHIGYKVENFFDAVNKLEALNYKAMEPFQSEAFGGKRAIFLFSPEAHLIELIEK